jgi:hypothetical protein
VGIARVAGELGVEHKAILARNEYGTPLLPDIFRLGSEGTRDDDVLCYINTDIILTSDFTVAVEKTTSHFRDFLMVGERTDLELDGKLIFGADWEETLLKDVLARGRPHGPTGIDYFVFRGDLWGDMPPFALGRTAWDNWLVCRARSKGVAVIDATHALQAIHQQHDYAHVSYDAKGVWIGEEATRNRQLAGRQVCQITDATRQLVQGGNMTVTDGHSGRHTISQLRLRINRDANRLEQRWEQQSLLDHDRGWGSLNRRRLLHLLRRHRQILAGSLWRAFSPYLMK